MAPRNRKKSSSSHNATENGSPKANEKFPAFSDFVDFAEALPKVSPRPARTPSLTIPQFDYSAPKMRTDPTPDVPHDARPAPRRKSLLARAVEEEDRIRAARGDPPSPLDSSFHLPLHHMLANISPQSAKSTKSPKSASSSVTAEPFMFKMDMSNVCDSTISHC